MNNIVKKSIIWHFDNEEGVTDYFNPELTAYVNSQNKIYISIKIGNNEDDCQFTVLDLPTAKDFALHILKEIKKIEKEVSNG